MRRTLTALISFVILSASAAQAQLFNVKGVPAGDHLNVRSNIDGVGHFSEAPVIGTLDRTATGINATGRSVTLRGAEWREIFQGGNSGWVNSRFLEFADFWPDSGSVTCHGTEPFWDLAIDPDAATGAVNDITLDAPIQMNVVDFGVGVSRPYIRSATLQSLDGFVTMTAIAVFTDQCSDGMSDYTFAYDVYLTGLDPHAGVHHGCCSFGN